MVEPKTPAEKELTKIWAEILCVDRVGIPDNFFELGGHSLLATQIISQVISTFRLELAIKSLFDAPTVAELAGVIAQNQAKKAGHEELSHMLTELEALSDEEAKRMLPQEIPEKQT